MNSNKKTQMSLFFVKLLLSNSLKCQINCLTGLNGALIPIPGAQSSEKLTSIFRSLVQNVNNMVPGLRHA